MVLFTLGQADAADYLRWVPAKPPQSCATLCDSALGYDAVYNKVAHKPGTLPTYVCSSLEGVPGANHTYSQDAARLCHLQSAGKGFGSSDYSCLCAPK
jgi:hypothetical protein